MSIIYGPVPSRRLGMSLGIDPVPPLTCTFDCIYCQLGKTEKKVSHGDQIDAKEFPTQNEILEGIEKALDNYEVIDYITFSGSGEPTLNPELGELISKIRKITDIPLALITNSSLLPYEEVLQATQEFDLIMPSLDAGDQETFKRVNRPAGGFKVDAIVGAIADLKTKTSGDLWLEVMLVKSESIETNFNPESIQNIGEKIKLIKPDKICLNTCVRPPAEEVDPLSKQELTEVKSQLEKKLPGSISIKAVPGRTESRSKLLKEEEAMEEMMRLLSIRPCRTVDISDATGLNPSEVGKYMTKLLKEEEIIRIRREGEVYYKKDDIEP